MLTWLAPLHRRLVSEPRRDRLAAALSGLAVGATSILDVGAGDGAVGAAVASLLGARIEGADATPNPRAPFPVTRIDGEQLPFPDAAFDVVLLSDVLHHTRAPDDLLREALRVAGRSVVVKDHFAFGPWSERMLLALDVVGNRPYGVAVRGEYATAAGWLARFQRSGATLEEMVWPLDVHGPAIRTFTRSEHQFAARLSRGPRG
ncbi:MAG: methyltransferase domain-containing protein [Myxococcales bacterium]|nr:methyltransferase domain-containing protein [Myxococcales bacterium]